MKRGFVFKNNFGAFILKNDSNFTALCNVRLVHRNKDVRLKKTLKNFYDERATAKFLACFKIQSE